MIWTSYSDYLGLLSSDTTTSMFLVFFSTHIVKLNPHWRSYFLFFFTSIPALFSLFSHHSLFLQLLLFTSLFLHVFHLLFFYLFLSSCSPTASFFLASSLLFSPFSFHSRSSLHVQRPSSIIVIITDPKLNKVWTPRRGIHMHIFQSFPGDKLPNMC